MILRFYFLAQVFAGSFENYLPYEDIDRELQNFGARIGGETEEGRNVRVFEKHHSGNFSVTKNRSNKKNPK